MGESEFEPRESWVTYCTLARSRFLFMHKSMEEETLRCRTNYSLIPPGILGATMSFRSATPHMVLVWTRGWW
jgi:hypothetical protein